MNSNDIPWNEIFEGEITDSTANVSVIMQDYCQNIEKSSGGVVHARFEELKIVKRISGGNLLSATAALMPREESFEENALPQANINELLEPSIHVFDIYNESYQFRLCELSYGYMYPAEIDIDDGVKSEILELLNAEFTNRDLDLFILHNDDELKSCFRHMFMSKKMKDILLQLRFGYE